MKQNLFKSIAVSIFLLILSTLYSVGQTNNTVALFTRDIYQEQKWNALRSNQQVSIIQYDLEVYKKIKSQEVQTLNVEIPTPDVLLKLNLTKNNLLSEGFILHTDKDSKLPFTPGLFYKGEIEGQPGSTVAISFFDDEVAAVIHTLDGHQYVIGASDHFRQGTYVVYDAAKTTSPVTDCLTESLPDYDEKVKNLYKNQTLEQRAAGGCVNIYFELGNSVYINKGSSTAAANYLTSIFNVVAMLYANAGITVKISEIFVWTTPESYNTSASTALTDFGRARQRNFNGDLAQMVRLKTNGSFSGIAWVDVLCYPYIASQASGPFSYAEISSSYNGFPSYSWTTTVITHELGHNFGSPHTHSCSWPGGPIDNCRPPEGSCAAGPTPTNGGTIMSYCHLTSAGINYNNGFGPQPTALINSRVNTAACIVACSTSVCNAPAGLTSSNITSNSTVVSWSAASGSVSYAVNYKTSTASVWIPATAATTNTSFSLTGLTANTSYQWQVRSNCSSYNSAFVTGSFITAPPIPEACNPPSSLTVTGLGTTTATLNWLPVPGATNYRLQYKTSVAAVWITASASLSTTTYTLSGLIAGTSYQWQVASNCGTTLSPYVAGQFSTASNSVCAAPVSLTSTNLTNTTAKLAWSAVSGAFNYSIELKSASASSWTALNNTSLVQINISGLQPGTTYQWRVKTNCGTGSSSYTQAQFNTTGGTPAPITCNEPGGLAANNLTSTSASLSWNISPNALNYTIEYKLVSSATWTIAAASVTTTNFTLTNLTANSTYDWRVKSNCSTSTSGFSTAQFSTIAVSTSCPGSYDIIPNENLGTAPLIPLNATILGRINSTSDNDFFKFVLSVGGSLTVSLSTLPADFDLRLYNNTGVNIGLSQNPGTNTELINTNLNAGTYYIRILGWGGINNPDKCYTLRVQTGTAQIEHYEELTSSTTFKAAIYPNPVSSVINYEIEGLKGSALINISDVQGRTLIIATTKSPVNHTDVSTLYAGVYLLRIVDEQKRVVVQKFMKMP